MASGTLAKARDEHGELNAREFRFVENFVCGADYCVGNAYRSAVRAGYSHETSATWSSTWIRSPDDPNYVQANPKPHVYHAIMARRKQIEDRIARTNEEIIAEIERLAFARVSPWLRFTSQGDPYIDASMLSEDELASIQGAEVEDYWEGRGDDARLVKRVKLKQYDKKAALDLLTKIRGMQKTVHSNDPENPMPATNVNVGQTYDLSKLTLDEREQLVVLLEKAKPD